MTREAALVSAHGVRLVEPTDKYPYWRIDYRTSTGQRRQPSAGKDYAKAAAKAALIEAQLAARVGDGGGRTVAQLAAAWLAARQPGWAPRTYADHAHTVAVWVNPYLGKLNAAALHRDAVAELLAAPKAPAVRRHVKAAVSGMLTWGYPAGWVNEPRAALVAPQHRTAAASKGLSGEGNLFIAEYLRPSAAACGSLAAAMRAVGAAQRGGSAWGQQLYLMVAFSASTGVRQGELFALRVGDLDFGRHQVAVDRQLVRVVKSGPQLTPPKWGRTRTVALPALSIFREPLTEPLRALCAGKAAGDLLFPAQGGGYLTASNYDSRQLLPARAAAPLWTDQRWSHHSLRHSYCTHLYASWEEERDAGGNIIRERKVAAQDTDVASAAGHKDSSIPRRMYTGATAGVTDRLLEILA